MAYRKRRTRRTSYSRSARGSSRRSFRSARSGARRTRRTGGMRRGGSQTVRLVIQQAPNPGGFVVGENGLMVGSQTPVGPRRARF